MTGWQISLVSALLLIATALWVSFLVTVWHERREPWGHVGFVLLALVGTLTTLVLDVMWVAKLLSDGAS